MYRLASIFFFFLFSYTLAVTLHLPGRGNALARENRLLRTQVEALEARLNRLEGQLRGREP
jgi:hypothetical protein